MAHCSSCQTDLTKDEQTYLDDQCSDCEYESHAQACSLCTFCSSPLYTPVKRNGDLYCSDKCSHSKEQRRGKK
ncbi:hypothetical protein [Pseudoalteromonas sp. bablab_jr010]|uniref:hypothetical protein n=1 Tax=Pseudoalteromonas sp. bablab_jr010 TaxID=2755063 RepID=UPI0018F4F5E4|nr:hypothetical protein [Pseudoalteromonas sp. bablab_jr010]